MASEGPNFAGTGADDSSVGTQPWTNTGNITASDDSDATCIDIQSATSHYLKATNFGFSIPTGATIDGIIVEWEQQESSNTTDNSIKIVKGDAILGDEQSVGAAWTTSDNFASYGGSSDLWGLSWTHSDINASDFGVVLSCSRSSAEATQTARVDSCRITMYYTAGAVARVPTLGLLGVGT